MPIPIIASGLPRGASIAALLGFAAFGAAAQTPLTTQNSDAVGSPIFACSPPGDSSRIMVLRQNGVIRLLRQPQLAFDGAPFMTVPNCVATDESGLLGLAFHPNYASNGYFYLHYNEADTGDTVIARFTRLSADQGDPNSRQLVLRVERGLGAHNAGWIGFGIDGMLYVTIGDDSQGVNSQTLTGNLKGKILRVDVDGDDFPSDPQRNYAIPSGNPLDGTNGDRAIWSWGLRNPFRCGIDRATGALYVSDVGDQLWEEVNYQPAGVGGQNYGWPCWEAGQFLNTGTPGCNIPTGQGLTMPFLRMGHNELVPPTNFSPCAIIGGEVYRGCAIPDLVGRYFFGDLCTGSVFSVRFDGSNLSEFVDHSDSLNPDGHLLISFGTDALGEILLVTSAGVRKVIPASFAGPDCNANGVADACDIALGHAQDANGNGVPDSCEAGGNTNDNGAGGNGNTNSGGGNGNTNSGDGTGNTNSGDGNQNANTGGPSGPAPSPADFDADGRVNLSDLAQFLIRFGLCGGQDGFAARYDLDGSGCLDIGDLPVFIAAFEG